MSWKRINPDETFRRLEAMASAVPTSENLDRLNRERRRRGLVAYDDRPWLNVWIGAQPRASLEVNRLEDWLSAISFLEPHFTRLFRLDAPPRRVWDVSLRREVFDPPPKLTIKNEDDPALDFSSDAMLDHVGVSRQHRRIPARDPYVAFQLIDSYLEPGAVPGTDTERAGRSPAFQWANAYRVVRVYGGPEEGGWWYNRSVPVASVYCQSTEACAPVLQFLEDAYGHVRRGDIYSVLGGEELYIYTEDEPARDSGGEHYE